MRTSKYSDNAKAAIVEAWRAAEPQGRDAMAAVAKQYEISTPTLYGWEARLRKDGSLPERARLPTSANSLQEEVQRLRAESESQKALIERLKQALRVARPYVPAGVSM